LFAASRGRDDARNTRGTRLTQHGGPRVDCYDKIKCCGGAQERKTDATEIAATPDVVLTIVQAVSSPLSRATGFLSCTISSQRRSVPPEETRFSGLYRNKPAAQRTAEREPVFLFVPQQTGGAVRPQATPQKETPLPNYKETVKGRRTFLHCSTLIHTKHTSMEPSHPRYTDAKAQGKNSFSGPPWAKRGCFAQPLKAADTHVRVLSLPP
jgi:hypothetical protein